MKVVVVDYGMGNLHSVLKSVQVAQIFLARSTPTPSLGKNVAGG